MNVVLAGLLGSTILAAPELASPAEPSEQTEAPQESPSPEEAEKSTEELDALARDAYEARDYETAVQLFIRAHELSDDPNYLFNIGRVYEESGDLEQAVYYYNRFLEQGEVSLEARRGALERVEVLQGVLESRERDEEAEAGDAEKVPPNDAELLPADSAPPDPKGEQRRRKLLIGGAVVAGVGGAAVVAGAVMAGLAQRQANILDDELVALEDRRRRIDAANQFAIAADGLFISGGVVAATGIALIVASVVGSKRASNARASGLQWAPVAGAGTTGVTLRGRF